MAVWAAAMAASPWPRPSTTASNTPSMVGWIRCRSPEATSPGDGRLATPQAISGVEMTLSSCIATHPFFHGDGRTDADFGNDVEIVHQQFRSGQTHAQPSARGVAVLHGLRDIGDARPPVAGDDVMTLFENRDAHTPCLRGGFFRRGFLDLADLVAEQPLGFLDAALKVAD